MSETTKWISVKDRLPENEDRVLIFPEPDFDETGRIVVAFYSKYDGGTNKVKKGNWYCYDGQGYEFELKYITHWMPQPERPHSRPKTADRGEPR